MCSSDLTETLARDASGHGFVLAPGSIFFLDREHSPWLRFNAGFTNDARLLGYLKASIAALGAAGARPGTSAVPAARA